MSMNEPDVESPVEGRTVTKLQIDHAFGIGLWEKGGGEFHFRIEGPFLVRTAESSHYLDPEEQRSKLAPALDVFRKTAEKAVAHGDGTLELRFTDGTEIIVAPDPRYEACGMAGPLDAKVSCPPGGGLSVVGFRPFRE